ncbi:pheromone A receptor-domain-containing protein [Xylaria flabelliformis]|nr:pheromone A receptor-domain-containing protein [Xylaria flabelliformis]
MEQAPATNPGLLANLVSRVILAFASILVSWVPFRLLIRNGEFAAVVFIVDVATMNLITIVNSVIWHDDDWSTWWDGAGLCDIEVYLIAPLQTIYAASIFTIMYHLAQQVKVTGAARGRSERTRRNLIQAAIIFPVPLVQLIFTWFDLAQRYIIGTLIGCSAVYDASWPKILVYDAPPAVFALLAVPYAVLLWRRYHAITKQAQGILKSDGEASMRANRTRRRLYNMSLSILVVYVPIMIYFLVCNIKDTLPSYKAYDYNRMHWSATPYPWETILFVPSWIIPSDVINQPWISIATTVVIVAFFGMTMEARQIYRQYAGYLRLQTCLQKLKWKKDQDPSLRDENGKTLLSNPVRNSVKYQYAAYSPYRRPTTAEATYSENKTNHQSLFSRGRDSIIPTIERPDTARATGDPSHVPLPARTAINTPPAIPLRYSSLRSSFAFRTPTFQSIRKSIRIPSLRSRTTSGVSASSSKTTGERTQLSREDAVPMLPLYYNASPRGDDTTGLRRALSPFLVGDDAAPSPPPPPPSQGGISRAKCGPGRLEERGFQVRVPIAEHRGNHHAASVRVREAERASFPREQTFASLYTTTTSDTRTNRSRSEAGREAGREVGVAK